MSQDLHDGSAEFNGAENVVAIAAFLPSKSRAKSPKVRSCEPSKSTKKPSLADPAVNAIIVQGKAALTQLEQNDQTWPNWSALSRAMFQLQTEAMAKAETKVPQGPHYREAIKELLVC